MTEAPNMASITALEKSLQNCSLSRSTASGASIGRSRTSDAPENLRNGDTALELNSNIALPYQWEQCLDLETGEVYYINWADGTKEKEDPRKKLGRFNTGANYYCEEEEEEEDNLYDSDGSSSVVSPPSPSREEDFNEEGNNHILVVAGCKSCMMYFMLPKRVEECPKCNGLLLHFDRLENGSL